MAESWREGEEVVERAKMEMERREVGGREGAEERRGVRGEQRRGGEWVCRMSGGIEEQVCLCTFWSLYVDLELLKVEEKEVREGNFSTRRAGTPISPSELNSNHVPSPEDQLTDFFSLSLVHTGVPSPTIIPKKMASSYPSSSSASGPSKATNEELFEHIRRLERRLDEQEQRSRGSLTSVPPEKMVVVFWDYDE